MEELHNTALDRARAAGVTIRRAPWNMAEPALSDMLADPITQLLMRRDGVREGELRRLAARLRRRNGGGQET